MPKIPPQFVISKELAKKAAKLVDEINKRSFKEAKHGEMVYYRRLDCRRGYIPDIFVRPNIKQTRINVGQEFIGSLAALCARMNMGGCKEAVVIWPNGTFSTEIKELIAKLFACPAGNELDDICRDLSGEFLTWLKGLGGVMNDYPWGLAQIESDISVKLVVLEQSLDLPFEPLEKGTPLKLDGEDGSKKD